MLSFFRSALLTTLLLCLGMATPLLAQEVIEVIAETELEQNGKHIHIHSATGVPVLETASEYIGLSPKDGSVIWRSKRNATANLAVATGNGEEVKDFNEIVGTQLVFASGNLIDVTTGKVLIDGEERGLRRLRNDLLLPENELLLLEIGGQGAIYLYAINPLTNEAKFDVQLREVSGVSQMIGEDAAGFGDVFPTINAAGNLIYPNQKFLALIDLKTGALKWNEKFDPGYIFTNEKGDRMVIAEARGPGLGAMMAAANPLTGEEGGAPKKFGKKIHLIDTETGQSVWKKGEQKMDGNVLYITPYDGDFLVVHDEGMNIYDYNDPKAEGRWKKDYSEKGVSSVDFEDDGLMVYFKNKRMLVDPATGDEKWKKAEKLEKERTGFLWGLASLSNSVTETVGKHEVTFYPGRVQVGRRYYNYETIVVADDHIILGHNYYGSDGDGYIGRRQVDLTALDLSGDKVDVQRERIGLKKGMTGMDKTNDGVFVYNDRGYRLMDYSPGGKFEERAYEYYPDPTGFIRDMGAIAAGAGALAYGATQTANYVTSPASYSNSTGQASYDSYQNKMNASNEAWSASNGLTDRKVNGRIDEDFGFFFRRDGKEGATLFKVDKHTGYEVAKFRFDDLTPLYAIDYVNGRLYYQGKGNFKVFRLNN